MKKGAPSQNQTPAQNALARVGFAPGQSMGHAILAQSGFMIPALPVIGTNSRSMTQEQFETIVIAVLGGMPRRRAAAMAGVTSASETTWFNAGRRDVEAGRTGTAQAVYHMAIQQAEAVGYQYVQQALMMQVTTDWRAAKAVLEGRYDWGKPAPEDVVTEDQEGIEAARRERLRRAIPEYSSPVLIEADDTEQDPDAD